MKNLVSLLVALSVLLNGTASATALSSNPQKAMALVDQYIAMQSEAAKDPSPFSEMYTAAGKADYLAEKVAVQIGSLEAEDFNLFLLHLLDRYINRPGEREVLFNFMKVVRAQVESDLEITANLRQGPTDAIVGGSWRYGTWLMIAGAGALFGWKRIMGAGATAQRTEAFLESAAARAPLVERPLVYRWGLRVATHPSLWMTLGSGVAGSALGYYFDYVLQTQRTHRLDPLLMLEVAQSQLACDLSSKALDLRQKVNALVNQTDTSHLRSDASPVDTDIKSTVSQARQLLNQFPLLANLKVGDPKFQAVLGQLPPATDWQAFRKSLVEANPGTNRQCPSMAMARVIEDLTSDMANLDGYVDAVAPPQSESPPVKP